MGHSTLLIDSPLNVFLKIYFINYLHYVFGSLYKITDLPEERNFGTLYKMIKGLLNTSQKELTCGQFVPGKVLTSSD